MTQTHITEEALKRAGYLKARDETFVKMGKTEQRVFVFTVGFTLSGYSLHLYSVSSTLATRDIAFQIDQTTDLFFMEDLERLEKEVTGAVD